MSRPISSLALLLALFVFVGCPKEADKAPAKPEENNKPAATAPASQPGGHGAAAPKAPDKDAEYVADPDSMPSRVGVRRVFLRQPKVTLVRDPLFLPDGKTLVFVAKSTGVIGLWKMPADGTAPAELFQPKPLYDSSAPRSAKNRSDWFIGTPQAFPDGKHLIFDGSTPNPFGRNPNILGIASVDGGVINAVTAKGAKSARTPDVHPDGKTVIFAACDELRTGTLDGRGDQELETTVLFQLARPDGAKPSVCTVHRPRFSPDGKHVTFEVIGRHVKTELHEKYNIPKPLNESDGLIEPWIMNADGTGARRVLDDEDYEPVEGRLQSGGSKEPAFAPSSDKIAFSHGRMIVLADLDGKNARVVATSNVQGDGNTALQFAESDPAFAPDGNKLVSASQIMAAERLAPPGLSIIDLEAADPMGRTEP